MDLNNSLRKKSHRVNEATIYNLRQEYRLHYFRAVDLYSKEDDDLLYFETSKFLFYGYKVESIKTTYDSERYSGEETISYIGIMMFYGGEIYIGEFSNSFRPQGEGMMFFSVGAVLRGCFDEGKAHGNVLISLPSEVNVLARLDRGVIHKQLIKIDYKSNLVNYLKYVQGNFIEYEKESFIDSDLITHIRDTMGTSLVPDDIKSYADGSLYFGTFVNSANSIYYGFIKNGEPVGWGVTVNVSTLILDELKYIQEPLSWRLNNNLDEPESVAIGINQDGNMIFGLESGGTLYGELGVFYPRENKFQKAVIKNDHLEFEAEYFEGIPKNFVTNIYLEYLKNAKLPKRELNIVPIVFDLTYFNDLFFFYLYGHLKEKSREIFKDNLQLGQEGFFKGHTAHDSNMDDIADSIGNNMDMKKRLNSEDMTLFDWPGGNRPNAIYAVQSEIKRSNSPKSDKLNYVIERDNNLSFNKFSKTHGLSNEVENKTSHFLIKENRKAKTSHNIGIDSLVVIEETNEDLKKSNHPKDIRLDGYKNTREKLPVIDFINNDPKIENINDIGYGISKPGIQSQLERFYVDEQLSVKHLLKHESSEYLKTKYDNSEPPDTESPKEIENFVDTTEPRNLKLTKGTSGPRHKDKLTIISEIKAKLNFLLPPTCLKQLVETNPKFFGS